MKPPNPIIRQAVPADAPGMQACVDAAYRPYIARIGRPPGPMLDDYNDMVQRHQAFVAEDQAQIIGVLVLIHKDSGILLDNVAVHPAYQGKGIGQRLLTLAETEALRQGFAHIDLYTHERMTENIALYQRLGYVETARRTERGYQRVYMRKALSQTTQALGGSTYA